MLFNSAPYLFCFLPIAVLFFWLIARLHSNKLAALWLALCSLFFYGWWNPSFLPLLIVSIIFNYTMGIFIEWSKRYGLSGTCLFFAVLCNLSLLGLFKYADFFIGITNHLTNTDISLLHLALPLGISFFTFTQIAFLVDVHRGIAKEYSPIHYLLFVTYFPHLIAGPILHHKEMMPQFAANKTYLPQAESFALGLFLFSVGLFKKVVIADHIAPSANETFNAADSGMAISFVDGWIGALSYTMQLYFDFSGYVDMAIGSSKMLGIDLPINFNSPYKAVNISDFWRRWHMTLGRFFRDYVYVPLGGNRKGLHRTQVNIVGVMLLSGLWHGAGWTFIIWGGMHATLSVINNYWRAFRVTVLKHNLENSTFIGRAVSILLTFICIVFCWVYFRATTLGGANTIALAMLNFESSNFIKDILENSKIVVHLGILMLIVWLLPNTSEMANPKSRIHWRPNALWLILSLFFMLSGCLFMLYGANDVSEFLYFNF